MSEKVNTISLKLNKVKVHIVDNVNVQLKSHAAPRIYVTGAPGCGKSDIMRQICQEKGWGLMVQYVSNMALEQLTGLPVKPEEGKDTVWSRPAIFNFANLEYAPKDYKEGITPTILLLDDFHLLDRMMQKYMFQLLTYKALNGYSLPKNTVIVMAGNRGNDKAGAMPIPSAVVNRMMFVDVHSDSEDWLKNFAFSHGVRQDICTFIHNHGQYLSSSPLESNAWASPRSWTFLSQQMDSHEEAQKLTLEDLQVMATGCIGPEVANEFILYRELFAKWDMEDLFTKKWTEVKHILADECDKKILNVYAIVNATVSWLIGVYKDAGCDATKIKDKLEFAYSCLAFLLTLRGHAASTAPLVIAGLKYMTILKEVKELKGAYEKLITAFLGEMSKKRPADWIFYGAVQNLFGGSLNDKQREQIEKAKAAIEAGAQAI